MFFYQIVFIYSSNENLKLFIYVLCVVFLIFCNIKNKWWLYLTPKEKCWYLSLFKSRSLTNTSLIFLEVKVTKNPHHWLKKKKSKKKNKKTKATIWLNVKTLKNKNKENITQVTQHINKMERHSGEGKNWSLIGINVFSSVFSSIW